MPVKRRIQKRRQSEIPAWLDPEAPKAVRRSGLLDAWLMAQRIDDGRATPQDLRLRQQLAGYFRRMGLPSCAALLEGPNSRARYARWREEVRA